MKTDMTGMNWEEAIAVVRSLEEDNEGLKAAIALGQENCDAAYAALRDERDEARAKLAKLIAHLRHEDSEWNGHWEDLEEYGR